MVVLTRRQTFHCSHVATLAKHSAAETVLTITVSYLQNIVTTFVVLTT